jgi:hypothetical protein
MESEQTKEVRPVAEVSQAKEAIGLMGIKIADSYAKVLTANQGYLIEQNESRKGLYVQVALEETFIFYENVRSVFMVAEPYLSHEDKEIFKAFSLELRQVNNPKLLNLDAMNEICEFSQRMLKNANLTELGLKSHVEEIEEDYL